MSDRQMQFRAPTYQKLIIPDKDGEHVIAPVEVYVGAIVSSLDPEWREDVLLRVRKYMADKGLSARVLLP
jgi:hypothetical protein